MKNIVICFDGTWNTADAEYPTNVVKTAQMVLPVDAKGDEQVVFYDEGVGSTNVVVAKSINNFLGGAFGVGLMDNIEQAYRWLAFNYAPGDKIFVFGFSRGAFSARSFTGLIRACGILDKNKVSLVKEAVKQYQTRNREAGADAAECVKFRRENSVAAFAGGVAASDKLYPLTIEYVGLWDTVGALGLPRHFIFSHYFNKKYQFHDLTLSRMIKSARHALSIDEKRSTFAPSRWRNLHELNEAAAKTDPNPAAPPYLQIWFPGDHASVGGGGDVNGLWEAALTWVVEGAMLRGLAVDQAKLKEYRDHIDHKASVYCMKRRSFSIASISFRRWRKGPGEDALAEVSDVARQRIKEPAANLYERRNYRPKSLRAILKKHAAALGIV